MAVVAEPRPRVRLHLAPLVVLAGVLWLLGWLVGKVCVATVWVWAALKVGWSDARAQRR